MPPRQANPASNRYITEVPPSGRAFEQLLPHFWPLALHPLSFLSLLSLLSLKKSSPEVSAKARKFDGSRFRTAGPEPASLELAVFRPNALGRKNRTAAKDTKTDTRHRGFTVTSPLRIAVRGEDESRTLVLAAYHYTRHSSPMPKFV